MLNGLHKTCNDIEALSGLPFRCFAEAWPKKPEPAVVGQSCWHPFTLHKLYVVLAAVI